MGQCQLMLGNYEKNNKKFLSFRFDDMGAQKVQF
jgi:hypothetical protein